MLPRGKRLLNVVSAVLLTMLVVPKSTAATVQGTASATVVAAPLVATKKEPLRFGLLISGRRPGTVVVTTANERRATGGVFVIASHGFGRAEFLIRGQPDASYSITLPSPVPIERRPSGLPLPGPSTLRAVDLRSFSTTANAETDVGRLDLDGTDDVYVGGTLLVPAFAVGRYQGEVVLTIAYE